MTEATRPWSLRRRLTGRVLGLVIGVWLATIVLAALVLDREMNDMFDDELAALVQTTILYLDVGEGSVIPRHLGVETKTGERILRIFSQTDPEPAGPWPQLHSDGLHDAPGWRILRVTSDGAIIEAAHSTAWRREEIMETASAFLALVLPLIGLLLWGLRRTTSEATAPVSRLVAAVSARKPDDFSQIDEAGLPEELRPIAAAFGNYLSRIEKMRQAERDFVANAAHELRTPLAAIRGRLELSSDPDARATLPAIDALTRRLERLLQLSRLEAGMGLGSGPADLVRVLHLLLRDLQPRGKGPIHFDDGDMETLSVAADPDALAILLRNLLENALEHGTGEVRIRLSADGRLVIENPTTATTFTDVRFEKGQVSAGYGLGLSIVEALARSMRTPISRDIRDGRARIELIFLLDS